MRGTRASQWMMAAWCKARLVAVTPMPGSTSSALLQALQAACGAKPQSALKTAKNLHLLGCRCCFTWSSPFWQLNIVPRISKAPPLHV
jgi:hypothetical protein